MPLEEPLFSELIVRLDGESGMRSKVRLLASSWSLLRELSPEQRERLALAIGNRWAWRNIESYFGNPDRLSDNQRQVKAFFDDLRDTDPEELHKIGKEIREGKFATAQSRLMDAVGEALEDESDSEDDSQGGVEAEPESRREAPVITPPVAPPAIEVVESEPELSEPSLEEPAQRPSVTPPPVEPIVTVAAKASPENVAPEVEPEPVPAKLVAKPTPVEVKPLEALRPDASALSASELLRVLRRLSIGEVSSTRISRTAMVGSLTSQWAARRAVSAMIRSHSVADLDEALALVRQLTTATQQTWCLGDLVEHWDLDDDARRRVVAAAPTDSARSRLALRARRAV